MWKIISVEDLNKNFKVSVKWWGFWRRLYTLFFPEYREIPAVSGINFSVDAWEKVAFLWPNGAWKSTTIKMLTWILYPTSWNISVCKMDPSAERKKLVYKILQTIKISII